MRGYGGALPQLASVQGGFRMCGNGDYDVSTQQLPSRPDPNPATASGEAGRGRWSRKLELWRLSSGTG